MVRMRTAAIHLQRVGYIEGWYVAADHRHRWIGKRAARQGGGLGKQSQMHRDSFGCRHQQ